MKQVLSLTLQQQRDLIYKTLSELQSKNPKLIVLPLPGHIIKLQLLDKEKGSLNATIILSRGFECTVRTKDWESDYEGEEDLYRFLDLITSWK